MERLRQRADFLAAADGVRLAAPAFALQSRRRDDSGPVRVGFTVSKKNGTATERNRIRRRLRELVRRLDAMALRPHSDYVLIGRRAALSRDFNTMLDDLGAALKRLDRQDAKKDAAKNIKTNTETNANKRTTQDAARTTTQDMTARPANRIG